MISLVACDNGYFGAGCQSECHCSVPCNSVSGHCPKDCDIGWRSGDCQEGNFQSKSIDVKCFQRVMIFFLLVTTKFNT